METDLFTETAEEKEAKNSWRQLNGKAVQYADSIKLKWNGVYYEWVVIDPITTDK